MIGEDQMLTMSELGRLAARIAENPKFDGGDDVALLTKLASPSSSKD
jgi:hypothetical protein